MISIDAMKERFLEIFGNDHRIVIEACPLGGVDTCQHQLYPNEDTAIRNAVEKRRHEFTVGRMLAHRVIAKLDAPQGPLPMQEDRTPAWPSGIIGSITHNSTWCIVAAAPQELFCGVGIDIEDCGSVSDDITPLIMTERELQIYAACPEDGKSLWRCLTFSAKESVFKAQYAISRRMLEFNDIEIDADPCSCQFRACITAGPDYALSKEHELCGRFFYDGEIIGSGTLLAYPTIGELLPTEGERLGVMAVSRPCVAAGERPNGVFHRGGSTTPRAKCRTRMPIARDPT